MEPKITPLKSSGLVESAASYAGKIIGSVIRGASEAWFGPLNPVNPQAPPSTAGRRYDYMPGANLMYVPRSEGAESSVITYAQLRALAEPSLGGLDIVRLLIETTKDEMVCTKWRVVRDDGSDAEDEGKEIEDLLWTPNNEQDYEQFLRAIFEDLLVCDCATIYKRRIANGVYVPEPIDGTTIKRLIDAGGRTPLPADGPAYQQILKGVPAANLYMAMDEESRREAGLPPDIEEIIFAICNPRMNKLYGLSPVEQILTTIRIALGRQLMQLEEYDSGSTPRAAITAPDTWQPDQVKQMQQWLDNLLSGDTAQRSKVTMLPPGARIELLKPDALKNAHDEWLVRVCCYAFSKSPSAFVSQVNRATAESAAQQAIEQGLEPRKRWWASLMNRVIKTIYLRDGFRFVFEDEEITDPSVKVSFYTTLKKEGIIDADEAREKFGYPEQTEEQKLAAQPPSPFAVGKTGAPEEVTVQPKVDKEKDDSATVAKACSHDHDDLIKATEPRRSLRRRDLSYRPRS
jgi:hypothetical protein